jgi:hypothetical protein
VKRSGTIALVGGFMLLLPALALVLVGVAVSIAAGHQDESGYLASSLGVVGSEGAAVTTGGPAVLGADVPHWVRDLLMLEVRVVAESRDREPLFLGVARPRDVEAHLDQVSYSEIVGIESGQFIFGRDTGTVVVERAGRAAAPAPTDRTFWSASVSGRGRQELNWRVAGGAWVFVLMHEDGSPRITADITVAVRTWPLAPLAAGSLLVGLVLAGLGAALCVVGARRADRLQVGSVEDGSARNPPPSPAGPLACSEVPGVGGST